MIPACSLVASEPRALPAGSQPLPARRPVRPVPTAGRHDGPQAPAREAVPGTVSSPSPPRWSSVGALVAACVCAWGDLRAFLPPNTTVTAVGTAPGPCPAGWGSLGDGMLTWGPCSFSVPSSLVPLAPSGVGRLDRGPAREGRAGSESWAGAIPLLDLGASLISWQPPRTHPQFQAKALGQEPRCPQGAATTVPVPRWVLEQPPSLARLASGCRFTQFPRAG